MLTGVIGDILESFGGADFAEEVVLRGDNDNG